MIKPKCYNDAGIEGGMQAFYNHFCKSLICEHSSLYWKLQKIPNWLVVWVMSKLKKLIFIVSLHPTCIDFSRCSLLSCKFGLSGFTHIPARKLANWEFAKENILTLWMSPPNQMQPTPQPSHPVRVHSGNQGRARELNGRRA